MIRCPSPDPTNFISVNQVVVPKHDHLLILSLAHDSSLAGHLEVTKTYHRILRNFFSPGLKSDVAKYCQTCCPCQPVGKPNQTVPLGPLQPIPMIGELFERVSIDCVGTLPKMKSGHQFILTVMCTATQSPQAILLHTIKAHCESPHKFFFNFWFTKNYPERPRY